MTPPARALELADDPRQWMPELMSKWRTEVTTFLRSLPPPAAASGEVAEQASWDAKPQTPTPYDEEYSSVRSSVDYNLAWHGGHAGWIPPPAHFINLCESWRKFDNRLREIISTQRGAASRIEELEAEVEKANASTFQWAAKCNAMFRRAETAEQRTEKAVIEALEILARYGSHATTCASQRSYHKPCDCGFNSARSGLEDGKAALASRQPALRGTREGETDGR